MADGGTIGVNGKDRKAGKVAKDRENDRNQGETRVSLEREFTQALELQDLRGFKTNIQWHYFYDTSK